MCKIRHGTRHYHLASATIFIPVMPGKEGMEGGGRIFFLEVKGDGMLPLDCMSSPAFAFVGKKDTCLGKAFII